LRDHDVPVFRVRHDLAFLCAVAAGHRIASLVDRLRSVLGYRDPGVALRSPGMTLAALGSLRPFCSVFRPALLPILDPLRVEHAAQDVIAHTRKILDAAAADHDHRMLLQVMALARDVADDLERK